MGTCKELSHSNLYPQFMFEKKLDQYISFRAYAILLPDIDRSEEISPGPRMSKKK